MMKNINENKFIITKVVGNHYENLLVDFDELIELLVRNEKIYPFKCDSNGFISAQLFAVHFDLEGKIYVPTKSFNYRGRIIEHIGSYFHNNGSYIAVLFKVSSQIKNVDSYDDLKRFFLEEFLFSYSDPISTELPKPYKLCITNSEIKLLWEN